MHTASSDIPAPDYALSLEEGATLPHTVTFIHAADLHLGAPIRGVANLNSEWTQRALDAIPQAWDRIINNALSRKVDFLIIAGDIFDSVRPSFHDYLAFFRGLERLHAAGIPAYICTGNHDPLSYWQKDLLSPLPPSVKVFAADKPDFALYTKEGAPCVVLAGRSYPNKVWHSKENIEEGLTREHAEEVLGPYAQQAPFAVGVLHTGLHFDLVKAPVPPESLLERGFDYWALGHIHRRWVDDATHPHLSFSGCIQGRDTKEKGPRGVNIVTLRENEEPEVNFLPTASIVWENVDVDIAWCESVPDLVEKTMRELFLRNGEVSCERMVTHLTFVGSGPLHYVLADPTLREEVRTALNDHYPDFFCDQITNKTKAFEGSSSLTDRKAPETSVNAGRRETFEVQAQAESAPAANQDFENIYRAVAQKCESNSADLIRFIETNFFQSDIPLSSSLTAEAIKTLTGEAINDVLDDITKEEGAHDFTF